MRTKIILLLFLVSSTILMSCNQNDDVNSSNISTEDISKPEPIPILDLREENEQGELLEININIIDAESSSPIEGVEIFLYHADENGDYLPAVPGDETTAKYSGTINTNENGECLLKTIVPRKYETNGNQHIHLHSISAKGYDNKGGVILFDHDVNDEVREWATDTGFGFIIELTELNSVKYGELTIKLSKPEG